MGGQSLLVLEEEPPILKHLECSNILKNIVCIFYSPCPEADCAAEEPWVAVGVVGSGTGGLIFGGLPDGLFRMMHCINGISKDYLAYLFSSLPEQLDPPESRRD